MRYVGRDLEGPLRRTTRTFPAVVLTGPCVPARRTCCVACCPTPATICSGIYSFRDEQGLEVDFLVPHEGGVRLIEAKASATVTPAMTVPMQRLAAWRKHEQRGRIDMLLVHQPRRGPEPSAVVSPGVEAISWPQVAKTIKA